MSENKELEDVYGDKYPVLVFQTSLQKIQRYRGKKNNKRGEKNNTINAIHLEQFTLSEMPVRASKVIPEQNVHGQPTVLSV